MGDDEYKILFAEDEVHLREIMLELMTSEGLNCEAAADGMEATQLLQEKHFDLLITDLRMPRMDGPQLLVWCRQNNLHMPIIFLTANDELLPLDTAALNDCCARLLHKPVDFDLLLEAIEAAKQRSHDFHCRGKAFNPKEHFMDKDFTGQHFL